ncbi:NmrA family NAD(P)-binding protein [Amycolatopsis sp. GM8]|uniref:NmrA family NAD(P)-binding protein n=1 Tax=Amycolatopsis sp. GM8 TaxID=2896530 RepID=UPI001F3B5394|nr:NmrA family NAD(P)-binding protein [Amycolatopsis sp. GM8]
MTKLAVVYGATGQQGGAVARRLLAGGWRVRGVTRDPSSAKARALAGAEMVVEPSFEGVNAVFSVHPGPLAPGEDEFAAGKAIADAAHEHGVGHLVYSSGLGADMLAAVNLQQDKWRVEQYLATLGISATVLRPGSFMENYFNPLFGLTDGALRTAANPGTRQQYIALEDIAAFTALAFDDPAAYRGRTFELAGDALTPPEVAAAVSEATGITVPYVHLDIEELRKINPRFAAGYEALNSIKEPIADVPALCALHPGLLTFEAWLRRTGATKLRELLAG